jgi:hypothetical protein
MSQKRTRQIEQRIDRIKQALQEIGAMRPGSLTRQYKDPQHHTGAYWQISYTRQMRSRTEYVVRNRLRRFAARLPPTNALIVWLTSGSTSVSSTHA